jgi:hypothetical protein
MKIRSTIWGGPEGVYRRLVGSWAFDRSAEGYGTMTGLAVFTAIDQDRLAYREDGLLRLVNGQELSAQREYLFSARPQGFNVFFAEDPARLFQEVTLSPEEGALRGSAEHQCSADLYSSVYEFRSDGTFVIRHVARGPRKDYTMVTKYVRVEPGS